MGVNWSHVGSVLESIKERVSSRSGLLLLFLFRSPGAVTSVRLQGEDGSQTTFYFDESSKGNNRLKEKLCAF